MSVSFRVFTGGVIAAAVLYTLAPAPAFAHHSAAMYDRAKAFELTGVVKEFQWTNPHVWIQVQAKDGEWSVECTSVNFMARRGWSRDTIKPGDKIVLKVSPLKDGAKGGAMVQVITINGSPPALEPED